MTLAPTTTADGTQHQFGYEWDIYREIVPLYREQFLRWIAPVSIEEFQGKKFLDAGCGIGRNSYWPLQEGAASAVAFDYDARTVKVAQENLKGFSNAQVMLKSVYDIQWENEFDIVFCIGVLHHLPDARKAIENLIKAVKPGGRYIFWVYGYEGNERYLKFIDPVRRAITSRLPLWLTRRLATVLTAILKVYLLLPQRKPYLKLLKQMSFRHLESIAFDQLLPTIANYWRKEEVESLVKGLPVNIESIQHTNAMSWTITGKKLASGSK